MSDSGAVPAKVPAQQKQVTITVIANTKEVVVVPDTVRLSKSANDTATWGCPQGQDFELEFTETPFHGDSFNRDTAKDLLPRGDVGPNPNRRFKYSVTVDGITKDPGLIVDP